MYLTSFITTNQAINYTSFFPFFSPSTSAPFLKEIWLVIKCTVNFAKIGSLWQKSLPGSTFFDEDEGRRDPSMFCVCVWRREPCGFMSVCQATLYASCKLKMIVLRHSLCPIMMLVGGGRKCNNDVVQSFVCINVHCEKVERAPHCKSSVLLHWVFSCFFYVTIKEKGKKTCLMKKKVLYSDCHLGSVERNK